MPPPLTDPQGRNAPEQQWLTGEKRENDRMQWLGHFLESYPELAVFLAVGVGYILGDIKIAGIAFGPVTGSLLAGLAIGQFAEVPISGMAKSFLFLLFLFGIGYSVGPQFLQSLQRDGLQGTAPPRARLHGDGPGDGLHGLAVPRP